MKRDGTLDRQVELNGKDQSSFGQENAAEFITAFSWGSLMRMSVIAIAASVALGSVTSPAENESGGGKLAQIMERKDRVVQLSEPDCRKPPLLLIHGATDDPTEMMAIAREWRNDYNIFLYSYNYHKRIDKIAADLVKELNRLKAKSRLARSVTVIAFSYGATVFREAVILSKNPSLLAGARLIQLVPTAGGSFFARGMENPLASFVISMASKPAAAANPYGEIAKEVWDGKGNEKFYSVISPRRMQTILVENDANSVSRINDKDVQRRYKNGIGENVIVVPKSAGVTHEYFPVEPAGLEYLRRVMESPGMRANAENQPAS